MEKNSTTVYLAGIEFRLRSNNSEEYMQKLAVFVNKHIDETQKHFPTLSTSDCALLSMFQLADELQKSKDTIKSMETSMDNMRNARAREPMPVKRPFETVPAVPKKNN